MLTRAVMGPRSTSISKTRRRLAWLAAGGLTLSVLLGPAIGSVFAASVTPTLHEHANISECPLDGYLSINIPGNDSSGSEGGVTVHVTYHADNSLDFTATGGLVYVAYVKGGDNYNEYDYRPGGVASDTNLVSPDNGGEQVPAVSHSVYCVKETTETSTTSSESSESTTTTSESSTTTTSESSTTTTSESGTTTTTSSESSASTTTTSGQELPATGSPKATLPSTSTEDPTEGGPSNGTIALVLILLGAGAAGLVVLSPSSTRIRK